MHGRACADLLRAHGRMQHADNYELALDEVMDILAEKVGQSRLAAAMHWASAQLWPEGARDSLPPLTKN
jgi:hypothetical protein